MEVGSSLMEDFFPLRKFIPLLQCHSHELPVAVYTFRNEPDHLAWDYGQDAYVEYEAFLEMGVDAYFTDFPASLQRYFETKEMERIIENVIKQNQC